MLIKKKINPKRCKALKKAAIGRVLSVEGLKNNRIKRRLHASIGKLTEQQVKEIKLKLKEGIIMRIIAKEYNVSLGSISAIKHNKSYKDIVI